jgi:O-antigen/teichoic acid export membrane protein
VTQTLGLLAGIVCARYLGRWEYGQLGVIVGAANLFTALGVAGLGLTATKHVAELRTTDPARAGRIIGMARNTAVVAGVVVAVAFIALADWLSQRVLLAPQLATPLRLSAGILFFSSLNGYQIGTLTGFEAFKALAMANLVRGVISFPLLVAGAVFGGLKGAVLANVGMAAINWAAHAVVLHRQCVEHRIRIDSSATAEDFRILYRFSLPVLVATMSSMPAIWLSNAALARNSGFGEVGIFSVAMQWQTAVLFLTNAAGNLGLPMLSSVAPERNIAKYRRVLGLNFLLTSGSALVAAVPIAVAAPWIMRAYGTGFASGAKVLVVMVVSTVLSAMSIAVGHAIWSLDAPVAGMLFALMRGCVLVFAATAFSRFGAIGLAAAHLITMAVQTLTVIPYMIILLRRQARTWSC